MGTSALRPLLAEAKRFLSRTCGTMQAKRVILQSAATGSLIHLRSQRGWPFQPSERWKEARNRRAEARNGSAGCVSWTSRPSSTTRRASGQAACKLLSCSSFRRLMKLCYFVSFSRLRPGKSGHTTNTLGDPCRRSLRCSTSGSTTC